MRTFETRKRLLYRNVNFALLDRHAEILICQCLGIFLASLLRKREDNDGEKSFLAQMAK